MRIVLVLIVWATLAACSFSWPRVHRITVQQGNVVTQEMIDKLKPGMTRRQVAFIMGEPVLHNPFDADRWDYVYTIVVPRVGESHVRMSLFFDNDLLARFSGDLKPSAIGTDTEASEPAADGEPQQPEQAG